MFIFAYFIHEELFRLNFNKGNIIRIMRFNYPLL